VMVFSIKIGSWDYQSEHMTYISGKIVIFV
jgi:hypothetical protein